MPHMGVYLLMKMKFKKEEVIQFELVYYAILGAKDLDEKIDALIYVNGEKLTSTELCVACLNYMHIAYRLLVVDQSEENYEECALHKRFIDRLINIYCSALNQRYQDKFTLSEFYALSDIRKKADQTLNS